MGSIPGYVSSCLHGFKTLSDAGEFCIANDDVSAKGILLPVINYQLARLKICGEYWRPSP
jgi:hypothetical protein